MKYPLFIRAPALRENALTTFFGSRGAMTCFARPKNPLAKARLMASTFCSRPRIREV
jgi:hypothetical protein